MPEDSGGTLMVKQGAREQKDCSAVEGRNSTESSQEISQQSASQCSFSQNSVSQHCKDAITPLSNSNNFSSSCSLHAVRPRCNRRLSFADQLSSHRQTDRRDTVIDACVYTSAVLDCDSTAAGDNIVYDYCCHGHCGRNSHDYNVCNDKTAYEMCLSAKTCATRASETARPTASVINSYTAETTLNTVYCRGIFTDDDDDDEIIFSDQIKRSIDSTTEPGVSLDNNLGHAQRREVNEVGNARNSSVAVTYQSKVSNKDSYQYSPVASDREAPSSGSPNPIRRGFVVERGEDPHVRTILMTRTSERSGTV